MWFQSKLFIIFLYSMLALTTFAAPIAASSASTDLSQRDASFSLLARVASLIEPRGGFRGGNKKRDAAPGGFRGGNKKRDAAPGGFRGGNKKRDAAPGGFRGGNKREAAPGGFRGGN